MKVRVVTARHRGPKIYVGRPMPGLAGHPLGNPLGNPFKISRSATRQECLECLDRYRAWLDAHPERDRMLADLADEVKRTGYPLACWCGCWPDNPDLLCHAVELAIRVEKILKGVEV